MAFMREIEIEQGDIVVKSDHETAIIGIVSDVGGSRAAAGIGKCGIERFERCC